MQFQKKKKKPTMHAVQAENAKKTGRESNTLQLKCNNPTRVEDRLDGSGGCFRTNRCYAPRTELQSLWSGPHTWNCDHQLCFVQFLFFLFIYLFFMFKIQISENPMGN